MPRKTRYSAAFIEQALGKVFQRGSRTIESVADELNMNRSTLKGWMKQRSKQNRVPAVKREKRPQDWTLAERLTALHESHGLEGEALHAWCRQQGLFAHHLAQWRTDFCQGPGVNASPASAQDWRALKDENQKLQRELTRKEKALAEAAALLVLQKKFQALLGGEVE